MMQKEFEAIAGIAVTTEDYDKIIEPMYLATEMSKADFIQTLNLKFFASRVPKTPKNIKRMLVRDKCGFTKTPNGCYYHIQYVELVDVDIKTGKCIVKALEEEDFEEIVKEGHDPYYGYGFDVDYTDCVDTKKKPITWHGFL